jgi:hypothetical protein
MSKRIFVSVVFMLMLIGFTPAAHAGQDESPPAVCVGLRYGILFGEGIAVTCPASRQPAQMYRAVAYCATGTAMWHQFGTWVQPGFGPSAVACQGNLLSGAQVVGYEVETQA